MKHSGFTILAGFVILFTAIMLINEDVPERHEHQMIEVDRDGLNSVYITICTTDSMQVIDSGKHIKTRHSRNWVEGYYR